jgi:hypothetical protein
MRRMFATPKKTRKKPRSQAQTAATPKEQTPTKNPTAKQKAQPSDPIKRAFQNSEGSSAAKPVNLLQVRKKRKVSPTLVQLAATPPAPSAGPHAPEPVGSAAATAARAPPASASSNAGAAVGLSGPSSSEPAPAETRPTESHAGTFEDPLDI